MKARLPRWSICLHSPLQLFLHLLVAFGHHFEEEVGKGMTGVKRGREEIPRKCDG